MDWIEFEAKKGQTYWIEVISNQLGLPSDPVSRPLSRRRRDDKRDRASSSPKSPRSMICRTATTAAIRTPMNSTPPAMIQLISSSCRRTARIALLVRDQFGDSRRDPSFVYRLAIREPQPDFRLLVYPTSPPATQQQQAADAAGHRQRSPRRHDGAGRRRAAA